MLAYAALSLINFSRAAVIRRLINVFQAAFHLENQRVVNVNAVHLETLEIIQRCSRRGGNPANVSKEKKKTHKGFFNHMKEEQF